MFSSPRRHIQALLSVVDDMLVGAPELEASETVSPHPHRRSVTLTIDRRAGAVGTRPMHCLSPVRHPGARRSSAVRGAR